MTLATLVADVILDTSGFTTGVNNAKTQLNNLETQLNTTSTTAQTTGALLVETIGTGLGALIADGLQDALGAMWDFAKDSVQYASELETAGRRIDVVFGDNADNLDRWAQTTQDYFGVAEGSAKIYAAQIGTLLSTKDLSPDEIYEMSTALVELAGDLSAFTGFDYDTTMQKLLSGLRGETEAIEDLGLDVRATSLAAFAGLSESDFGKLDNLERIKITYDYIISASEKAQGFFAKNNDTYSAQLAEFNSNITQLKQTIGEGLLPIATDLLTFANDLFGGSEGATEAIAGMQEAFAESYADIDLTVERANNLITSLAELEASGEGGGTAWTAIVEELTKTLPELSGLIDSNTGEIEGGTAALSEYVAQWKATNTEIARVNLLQQSQNELLKHEMEVESLRNQVAVARLATTDPEEALADWYEDVREAYEMPEYYAPIDIAAGLGDYLAQDDALAQYFERRYNAIMDSGDNLEALESQLMAAERELADAQAANAIMLERIATLLENQESTVNVYIGDEQVTEVVSTQQGREAAKNAKTN